MLSLYVKDAVGYASDIAGDAVDIPKSINDEDSDTLASDILTILSQIEDNTTNYSTTDHEKNAMGRSIEDYSPIFIPTITKTISHLAFSLPFILVWNLATALEDFLGPLAWQLPFIFGVKLVIATGKLVLAAKSSLALGNTILSRLSSLLPGKLKVKIFTCSTCQ